ncbi:MAG: hypothetical protein LBB54_03350 [Cellulomonadaceae bacterium]|nr:hypothetical protein [Cellulomonadaceae bacterium]
MDDEYLISPPSGPARPKGTPDHFRRPAMLDPLAADTLEGHDDPRPLALRVLVEEILAGKHDGDLPGAYTRAAHMCDDAGLDDAADQLRAAAADVD